MQHTFGETIKVLRERQGLTLKEASNSLEIDFSMLARIEKGQRSVSESLFRKMADLFEADERELRINALADRIFNDAIRFEYAEEALKIVMDKIKRVE